MPDERDVRANNGAAPDPLSGLRIVIAEDNWLIADALKTVLERHGAIVAGLAPSVAELRSQVAALRPDLVVADLDLQGEIATPCIDELTSGGIPVVVTTGYPQIAGDGGNSRIVMLRKPVPADALIATIRRLMFQAHDGAGP